MDQSEVDTLNAQPTPIAAIPGDENLYHTVLDSASFNEEGNKQRHSCSVVGVDHAVQQFCCLFTKMKTQKRKIWQDGKLVLNGASVSLYDAHPPPGSCGTQLDQTELSRVQVHNLVHLLEGRVETDKFLIQVDGPWQVMAGCSTFTHTTPLVSKGMQKLMKKKFRKPGRFLPTDPKIHQSNLQQSSAKRPRKPLQPGDLEQRYYGNQQASGSQSRFHPAWNQHHAQSSYPTMPNQDHISSLSPSWIGHSLDCERKNDEAVNGDAPVNQQRASKHSYEGFLPNLADLRSRHPPQNHGEATNQHKGSSPNQWNSASCEQHEQPTPQNRWNGQSLNKYVHTSHPFALHLATISHQPSGNSHNANTGKGKYAPGNFASNAFNANIYHGEEESSGEEDTSEQFQWDKPLRLPSERTSNQQPQSWDTESYIESTPPGKQTEPSVLENASELLSRNQLLELLGGELLSQNAVIASHAVQPSVAFSTGRFNGSCCVRK